MHPATSVADLIMLLQLHHLGKGEEEEEHDNDFHFCNVVIKRYVD
jgi:hypothetical protein